MTTRFTYIIAILAIFRIFTPSQAGAQATDSFEVTISGTVKNAADSSPMQGVHLIRYNDASGTVTDQEGKFSLRLKKKTDSFLLSSVGFGRTTFDPPDTFKGKVYVTTIYLDEKTYRISEVTIHGKDDRSFEISLGTPKEEMEKMRKREELGKNASIQSPIDALYKQFSKDVKERRELARLRRNVKNREFLAHGPYRAYIESEFGLTGKEVERFLAYCRFYKDYTKGANYYEIIRKLEACYIRYKSSQR